MVKNVVCCMCGDVGFSDQLFRCSNCHNRFQHTYCSNYYSESRKGIEVCDWCQREDQTNLWSGQLGMSTSSPRNFSKAANANELVYNKTEKRALAEKPTGKAPSPRPTTRKYKLLKDVMCS